MEDLHGVDERLALLGVVRDAAHVDLEDGRHDTVPPARIHMSRRARARAPRDVLQDAQDRLPRARAGRHPADGVAEARVGGVVPETFRRSVSISGVDWKTHLSTATFWISGFIAAVTRLTTFASSFAGFSIVDVCCTRALFIAFKLSSEPVSK